MTHEGQGSGRARQKLRTRQRLLDAASALLARGVTPQVAEVAEEAGVSRATAFRYFPTQDALLAEVAIAAGVPTPEELFPDGATDDAEARAARAVRAYFDLACRRPAEFRNFLRLSLKGVADRGDAPGEPVRQGRRLRVVGAALEPAARQLGPARARRLRHALALLSGVEAMVVLQDVCGLDDRAGAEVVEWAAKALVRQALAEADRPARSRRR